MQITNCGRGVHRREVVGIERLRRLPSNWYAFTNLDLATGPGRSREIDLVVVAEDRIFLIDLKDWHGRIDSDNGNWLHNGRDTGPSPVAKIHQNAKDVGYLLIEHIKRHMKGTLAPRVVGLVVITGKADFSGIAATEMGSVFAVEDFVRDVSKPQSRVATFGPVARVIVDTPLTEITWKDQLGKFFNARTGPLSPGRRRYANFLAASDDATFEHPHQVYSEYEAFDENAPQTLGTVRIWDFTKAETRFQSEEGRKEIAGRERSVVEFLKDRGESCENAVLHPRAEDSDRGVNYWEVFDRRQRLKRMSEFVNSEASILDHDRRLELARQLVARVAAMHAVDAAHLDIGGHSVWLESPSTVKLSHLMAAQYAQVESLGESRYQFLASAKLPEDVLGGESRPKRKDVFLLTAAVHWLLFGAQPKSKDGDGMPFEWDPNVDAHGAYDNLHGWLERGLSLDPMARFSDATAALDAFNAATASHPNPREVIEGLERFRTEIRSQKQFFAAYPESASLRESDRLDIWRSARKGKPVLAKLWKRAAWGDQTREGPRILDFLTRANDLALSSPPGCAPILHVYWLADAIAVVQAWVEGPNLAEALKAGYFASREMDVLDFILRLANGVNSLHDQAVTHGDLKPENIIVSTQENDSPVLIDLVDFSATEDGEIKSNAYSPTNGGRMERDRFAVTRIAEELLAAVALPMTVTTDIRKAIVACRESAPENGSLLPLIEALERGLAPRPAQTAVSVLNLGIQGAPVGPLLADEGAFYIRKGFGRPSFFIRGACEEIEVSLDNTGRPLRARRAPLDQKRIGRLARLEFMPFTAEVAVTRSDITELSDLSKLMDDPAFVAGWAEQPALKMDVPAVEDLGEPHLKPAFEDAAFDRISEGEGKESSREADRINVRQLWRALIDAEGELTTDGVAQADSAYGRDLRRHIVPFELTSGTFDFNRNDRVGVERLDRKGVWRRIGELDIARSKPDRILIDANEMAISNQVGLVEADERLRFTSHFQVQSLKRRESAITRILAGNARIPGLSAAFEPATAALPELLPVVATSADLSRYKLNIAQQAAFQKLLAVRPIGALQGPPGTGKTHFISALAHYALTHGLARNILLASQSHEAVNNAAEAVLRLFTGQDEQPSILRVGNEGVVSERLMPFHTDRLEQLYKDRFRAEMRERLRIVGRTLGVAASVIEAVIDAETSLRPVAEKLVELRSAKEPDLARINSLAATLATQVHYLAMSGTTSESDDPLQLLDAVISDAIQMLPSGERPAPERVGKLRTIAQIGRDFVGSVSTQQRGFEAFLAGTRQIVAGTCVGLGRSSLGLTATPFDLVIIDEAARCTASELAVPMQAGRWVVLVGDHAQLEPQHDATVVSKVASDIGADKLDVVRSDFERLFANGYGAIAGAKLKTQYRMLPSIGKVVSDTFYDGDLEPGRDAPEVDPDALPEGLDTPITWITTECLGDGGEERGEETGTSRINSAEADAIVALLKAWAGNSPFTAWVTKQVKHAHVVGVICMYAAQRDLVRRKLQAANLPETFRRSIKIDTVDSYQGKENPIVIVSLVRNNTEGPAEGGLATIRAGFLGRPNRINVAVSRAMDRLVIVGAKTRWRTGTPMQKLAEAVELQFQAGEAKVIPVSMVLGGEVADARPRQAGVES